MLHTAASRVGGLDLGLVPGQGGLDAPAMAKAGALDLLINLGADEIDIEPGAFVVYIGTHGDRGAHRADVILPGAAYTEKSGIYVNTEGRPQFGERAVFPPGEAREDWAILRALAERLGAKPPYDDPAAPARGAGGGASASRQARRRHAGAGARRHRRQRRAGQGRFRLADPRLLPDQPHRARLARDGRMFGPGERPARHGRGIGPAMTSLTPSKPSDDDRR